MIRFGAAFLWVLTACGDEAQAPAAEAAAPEIAIHEWGVIAVPRNMDSLSALAMSGSRTVFAPWGARPRPRRPGEEAARPFDPLDPVGLGEMFGEGTLGAVGLKPVIYVHVPDEAAVELSVRVGAPNGRMMEVLPPSAPGPVTEARWPGLTATDGSCRSTIPPGGPRCGAGDGYCEALEDPLYDTRDAACLVLRNGDRRNHLFYRARVDASRLPLGVTVQPEGALAIENLGTHAIAGPAFRIYEGDDRSVNITRFDPPAPGATVNVPLPEGGDIAATRAAITASIRERGLTAQEASAFDRAWSHVLFGVPNPPEMDRLTLDDPPDELRASRDVVLYMLPEDGAAHVLPLGVDPRPTAVHRALFVRHDATDQSGVPDVPPGRVDVYGGHPPEGAIPYRVTLAETSIRSGALTEAQVREVVTRHRAEVEVCLSGSTVPLPGTVLRTTTLVGTNGTVIASMVEAMSPETLRYTRCVQRAVRRWTFPASDDISRFSQTYRLQRRGAQRGGGAGE